MYLELTKYSGLAVVSISKRLGELFQTATALEDTLAQRFLLAKATMEKFNAFKPQIAQQAEEDRKDVTEHGTIDKQPTCRSSIGQMYLHSSFEFLKELEHDKSPLSLTSDIPFPRKSFEGVGLPLIGKLDPAWDEFSESPIVKLFHCLLSGEHDADLYDQFCTPGKSIPALDGDSYRDIDFPRKAYNIVNKQDQKLAKLDMHTTTGLVWMGWGVGWGVGMEMYDTHFDIVMGGCG